jgi:excisionase family DNA binding protein
MVDPAGVDALRREVEAMPPGTLLPRDWFLARLDQTAGEGGVAAPAATVDLTIRDLAALFGRSPSTIRGWVERGAFPTAYRLNGREWRIPQAAVETFQQGQRRQGVATNSSLGMWRSARPRGAAAPVR